MNDVDSSNDGSNDDDDGDIHFTNSLADLVTRRCVSQFPGMVLCLLLSSALSHFVIFYCVFHTGQDQKTFSGIVSQNK